MAPMPGTAVDAAVPLTTNRRTRLLGYSGAAKAVALTPIAALTGGGGVRNIDVAGTNGTYAYVGGSEVI
jgi:hypothetical protein